MWHRIQRVINSYLDNLISRTSSPDGEVRNVTRAELARLLELEAQTRASAKQLEKELAEIDLKITGALEREQLLRQRGDEPAAQASANQAASLVRQQLFLKQQLNEATVAAERARALREQRKVEGESLATETRLTNMREGLSELQTPFSATDPAATLDEMRARIGRTSGTSVDARIADADRELEAARTRASVDEMLARYKQGLPGVAAPQSPQPPAAASKPEPPAEEEPSNPAEKTLGRNSGPVKPID
jgi:hypothetical protein